MVFELNAEEIKQIVERYFRVYDVKQEEDFFAFYVEIFEENFKEKFEMLLNELKNRNLIPFIREERGEHIIFITQKPPVKKKSNLINLALFIATVITTTFMGSLLYASFENLKFSFGFYEIVNGFLFFSIPLLLIIGIHESAHYIASKRHGIEATLPYFIPMPFPPLGTLGAVISIKEPIPDRNALLDIGIAGPLAGFIVAIPILFLGLTYSKFSPIEEMKDAIFLGEPLLFKILSIAINVPEGSVINMHPTAFAGWVGLLVTAINLLPAGQLDGGHIARAVLKRRHRYASIITVFVLLALTMFGLGNWLLMILLLVFLIGTEHPPPLNEITPLDRKRKILAIVALIIFILSFSPMPMR
ncbi:MAG: site-2 protease family protein [Thermoplasmatales archaeon]|nr:site-2 protease family protein [Thermoplasmatales archaeon]